MGFNTYLFILVFLPVTVIGYHMINRKNHFALSKWFLLFMSFLFAFISSWQGTLVCLGLILINFSIYKYGYKTKNAKVFVTLGVLINVLSLMYFKYLGIFMVHDKTGNITGGPEVVSKLYNIANLIVPVGISFITFSQISFLIDTYKDNTVDVSLFDYALYVMFFPKLTMGPIALSKDFIVQINDTVRKKTNYDNIAKGLMSFSFGLAKKALIADLLAGYVTYGYEYTPILGMINSWIVVIAYTLQIYFDFSGFCDMAQGVALMLNFDLPKNFDSPYRSLSIGEFWDRWHITLTKFFTKYIYIPLGGNRKGKIRTYLNIMIVFLISGIWHGSTINFVIWGLMHGVLSCISRAMKPIEEKIPKAIRWAVTFIFINIAWVYFRAPSLLNANLMIKEMFSFRFNPIDPNFSAYAFPAELEIVPWLLNKFTEIKSTAIFNSVVNVVIVLFGLFASTRMKNTNERMDEFKPSNKMVAITVILLIWSIMSLSDVSNFIYVNF